MSEKLPVEVVWTGDEFRPINSWWVSRARRQYVAGEVYHMVDQPERSGQSHRHLFAAINQTFDNLPPLLAEQFKSPDHLRRYAMIKAGICNSQSMPCGSPDAARKLASFIRPLDEFAVVDVKGSVVTVYRAKSMSYKEMSKEEFQKAKTAVLEVLAEMIGVASKELTGHSQADYLAAG